MGAIRETRGKATAHAITKALSQRSGYPESMPVFTRVITADIIKDIKQDIKKAKTRLR